VTGKATNKGQPEELKTAQRIKIRREGESENPSQKDPCETFEHFFLLLKRRPRPFRAVSFNCPRPCDDQLLGCKTFAFGCVAKGGLNNRTYPEWTILVSQRMRLAAGQSYTDKGAGRLGAGCCTKRSVILFCLTPVGQGLHATCPKEDKK